MNISKQTHSGTLSQSRTLAEQTADKQRSARNGFAQRRKNPKPTGIQHVRGERERDVNTSPSPAIRLVGKTEDQTQPVALKLDPGANVTGVPIVRQVPKDPIKQILHLDEVSHRGQTIRKHMTRRAMFRRRRRTAYVTIQGFKWKRCRRAMPFDDYTYAQQPTAMPPTAKAVGLLA